MSVLLTTALSLVLHVTLGWVWTPLAAIIGGVVRGRGGWWVGLIGVGLGWMILLVASVILAPGQTARLLGTLGRIMGNLPGAVLVGATLFMGALLGVLGGLAGSQGRAFVEGR